MNEMNILNFVEEYKAAEDKNEVFEKIKIEKYVSFIVKKGVIEAIINSFLETENGLYAYDAMNKHLSFVLGFISIYTNLSYDEDEEYVAYDELMATGLVDKIIEAIGYDYGDFVNLFEETLRTKIEINNSSPAVLNSFLIGLTAAIENLDKTKLEAVLENIK